MNDITEMILITDVKHERIPSLWARCFKSDGYELRAIGKDEQVPNDRYETEDVEGTVFRRPDGTLACIGMTKRVHHVLGLPVDCWKDMSEENDRLRSENSRIYSSMVSLDRRLKEATDEAMTLRRRILDNDRRLNGLTLWQRVRILFGAHPLIASLDNE